MDIRDMIGQHLVAGFEGKAVPDAFKQAVKTHRIGNVILFVHNVENKEQLRALCARIQEVVMGELGVPAFITIDQEGGAVSRLKDDCAVVPGAMAVASTGSTENAYMAGLITGRELHAMGVNFDLAPVFDVNSNPDNPVIGVRSYGDTPEKAAPYALQMMKGLQEAGVLACAKHFPGHGDTAVDSHVGLPSVNKTMEELQKTELPPFQAAIDAGIAGIMSTHILFPKIEEGNMPATMSRRIMTGLLKETMGFQGLVLSDCMMMGAIKDHYGTVNGMVRALAAGVDLIFASHSIDLNIQAADEMLKEVQAGGVSEDELRASTERILACKKTLRAPKESELALVGSKEHRAQVAKMYEQSLAAVQLPLGKLPETGDNPLFISCPPFITTLVSNPLAGELSFAETMQARFGGDALTMSIDPTEEEVRAIQAKMPGHTAVVVATYNGHIKTGQLAVVKAAARSGVPAVAVALRNPYDLKGLPENMSGIAAYAYSRPVLDALQKALAGEIALTGRLPVDL